MSLEVSAKMIVQELLKPENADLAFTIAYFGDSDKYQSFMWGFATPHHTKVSSFDEYADFIRSVTMQLNEQGLEVEETVNMSASYDRYLESHKKSIEMSPIDANQADRFEAILKPYDDGWSGAAYGFLCRKVQALLLKEMLVA